MIKLKDIKGEEISKIFPEAVEIDSSCKRKLYSVKDEENKPMLLETNKFDIITDIIDNKELKSLQEKPLRGDILSQDDEDNNDSYNINIPY